NYVTPPLDCRTLYVLSAQNTGKTVSMINNVKAMLDAPREDPNHIGYAFFIVSRRSLATRLLGGLEDSGVTTIADYRQIGCKTFDDIKKNKRGAVICLDSLGSFFLTRNDNPAMDEEDVGLAAIMTHHVKIHMRTCKKVMLDRERLTKIFQKSVFVFDEIRSLLEYVMMSDTLKTIQGIVRSLLFFAVKESKKVVFMDSAISIETLDCGISLRGSEGSILYWNTIDPPKKSIVFHETVKKAQMMSYAIVLLKEGRNIFITSDSKKFVDKYADIIKDVVPRVRIIKYTSDTSDRERLGLANPNEAWSESTCVICSPTVTYGVDHTIMCHFYAQFHFFHGHSQTGHGSFQQMGRTRFIESRVHVNMDMNGSDEDLVVENIDKDIHKYNTCAARRLNSEFDAFDQANMADLSDNYLLKGTDESQMEVIRIDRDGECLVSELTYRLFLYAQSWRFCQHLRMECMLRDLCLSNGYEVLVDVPIMISITTETMIILRTCQMTINDLKNHSRAHPSGISLIAMTPDDRETLSSENAMNGVKSRVMCAIATEGDNKIMHMRNYLDGLGFLNIDGLEERDLSVNLRMRSNFDPVFADHFQKVVRSSNFVYKDIISKQNESFFMKLVPTGTSVEILQVIVSWFFSSPLVMRRGDETCLISVDDMDGFCPMLINLVLKKIYAEKSLSIGFGLTKSFMEEFGPVTTVEGVIKWTRKQCCKIFQTVMKKFLNITVNVTRTRSATHATKYFAVKINLDHRDALLEIIYARLINGTTLVRHKDAEIAFVEFVMRTSRPVLRYMANTKIVSYPGMGDPSDEEAIPYAPMINQTGEFPPHVWSIYSGNIWIS
ncbi:MAG: hypothetical protein WB421_06875, partial [Terriglobales bacterium]